MEKMIMRFAATSNNGGEYQNWKFVKTISRLSNHNLQIQSNNRFFRLQETTEDWNETENGGQKEICPNNNISRNITYRENLQGEAARNIRKIGIIGDNHIRRLNKRHFNEKINGKVYFNVFWSANIKRVHHFIQPTLHEDKPYTKLIYIGSNDIIPSKQRDLNVNDVVQIIIDTGLYCRECDVKDVIISSILVKPNFYLTKIIRQIDYLLSEYCVSNNFHYLTNDNISRQNLWKDGIHLNNVGNNILAENFISYVNE